MTHDHTTTKSRWRHSSEFPGVSQHRPVFLRLQRALAQTGHAFSPDAYVGEAEGSTFDRALVGDLFSQDQALRAERLISQGYVDVTEVQGPGESVTYEDLAIVRWLPMDDFPNLVAVTIIDGEPSLSGRMVPRTLRDRVLVKVPSRGARA